MTQVYNLCTAIPEHPARQRDDSVSVRLSHGGKGLVERIRVSHFHRLKLYSQGSGGGLHLLQDVGTGSGRMPEIGDTGDSWHGLLEQLQPFPHELWVAAAQPRGVPARLRQAGDEPLANRVRNGRQDDGDRHGGMLCRRGRLAGAGVGRSGVAQTSFREAISRAILSPSI